MDPSNTILSDCFSRKSEPIMEVKDILFMNKGDGGNSYVHNSGVSQKVASMTKPVLEETVRSIFSDFHTKPVLNVADLGCASGPNTFSVMSTVISTVENISKELDFQIIPEIQFYLNDLHGNDFNTLFHGLSGFGERNRGVPVPYFVVGAPGSFHGRLFPKNSMDLVHSSYCVHWLSKVPNLTSEEGAPLNKRKMYISKTSPPIVREAYLTQFRDDFSSFLKSRSQEMVLNGRIILIVHGRNTPDPTTKDGCYLWELLANAITQMISQGMIDEEKLDSFNIPYYSPSTEEMRDLVDMEGSFVIERLETMTTDNRSVWSREIENGDELKIAEAAARNIRSFTESVIAHQFGQDLMDKLYRKFVKNIVMNDLSEGPLTTTSIMIVLNKIV